MPMRRQAAGEQNKAEIAAVDGPPVGCAIDSDDQGVAKGQADHRQQHRHGSDEFGEHDVDLAHRRSQQQFERAGATLFGEQSHGEQRHQQNELHRRLEEHRHQTRLLGDKQSDSEAVAAQQQETVMTA